MSSEDLGLSETAGQFREMSGNHRSMEDEMFECLVDRERRVVLRLLDRGAVETEADLLYRGKEEAKAELVHDHLPKLAEAGYIEWDRETGRITKGPQFEEIEPFLELIEEHSEEVPDGWQ